MAMSSSEVTQSSQRRYPCTHSAGGETSIRPFYLYELERSLVFLSKTYLRFSSRDYFLVFTLRIVSFCLKLTVTVRLK